MMSMYTRMSNLRPSISSGDFIYLSNAGKEFEKYMSVEQGGPLTFE